jgi:trimeric autotransporter adhesin
VNGTVAGLGAYVNTSDRRLKKDIRNLTGSDLLKSIRPVSFDWIDPKDSFMEVRQYGFIAQEVEEVFPNLVSTADDSMHTKSVNYTGLIPLMVSSIQELQDTNKLLKSQNDSLQARIDAIEHRLDTQTP